MAENSTDVNATKSFAQILMEKSRAKQKNAPAGIPAPRQAARASALGMRQAAPSPGAAAQASTAAAIPGQARPNPFRFFKSTDPISEEERIAQILAAQAPDSITGFLTDVRIYNDWGIGKIIDPTTGRGISVKGAVLTTLEEGVRYRFDGKRSVHPKYGDQFDIVRAAPDIDSSEALVSHIRRNYSGIGLKGATEFVRHHQDQGTLAELKEALIHAPSSIDFSGFSNRPVALKDDENSRTRRIRDSLSIRLSGLGVPQNAIAGLAQYLESKSSLSEWQEKFPDIDIVSRCNKILDADPYEPVMHVDHYGFRTADIIAKQVGIDRLDPRRQAAIATYAIKEGCNAGGHVWLTEDQFIQEVKRVDYSIDPLNAFELAVQSRAHVVRSNEGNGPRYYTRSLRHAELQLANQLAMRLTHEVEPLFTGEPAELEEAIEAAIKRVGQRKGMILELDESQRSAVYGILSSTCSLHTLTGGPGCGKTTIVEVIMETLMSHRRDLSPVFCAPTGKAAKELNKRIRNWGQSKTIVSVM